MAATRPPTALVVGGGHNGLVAACYLAGAGIRLAFDDGESVLLEPPHGRHRFAGERGLTGAPVAGPTQDFNLMWRRDRIVADLWHRPLVGAMVVFAEPRTCWAVHSGWRASQARAAPSPSSCPSNTRAWTAAMRRAGVPRP